MSQDAIRLTVLLAHDDIREANRTNALHELVESTVRSIRNDLTAATQKFLSGEKPKATKLE